MSSQNGSIAAVVIVGILVFGMVAYSYYTTSNSLTSLSEQNSNLQAGLSGVSQQNALLNQQVSSLEQQVSVLEQRTVQVVSVTNTVVSVVTSVSVSTVTTTSTSTVYPIPDNVTVLVVASGQFMNYGITAGSYSVSGSLGNSQSFAVTPVYQGEVITVTVNLSCPGSTGPSGSASLYVNSALVSHTSVACGGTTSGQISYTL